MSSRTQSSSSYELGCRIIKIIGSTKVKKIYNLTGSKPVSFSFLNFIVRKNDIETELKKKRPIIKIAKKFGVSRMTIYRILMGKRGLCEN